MMMKKTCNKYVHSSRSSLGARSGVLFLVLVAIFFYCATTTTTSHSHSLLTTNTKHNVYQL
jgi:hypothetical protein